MREIKYRGWDEELKKWHYGNYYFYTDTIYCVASDKDHEENEHHCILFDGFCDWDLPRPHYKAFVNKNTVGQFTGLHDKNGVEIYENDAVKSHKYNGIVEYREDSFIINWEIGCPHNESLVEWSKSIKVIGNIHEREDK